MRKLLYFIQKLSVVYLILSFIFILIAIVIRRRLEIDIYYVVTAFELFVLSTFITTAIEIFKLDKIPTAVRIVFGYLILFFSTFYIRNAFGKMFFRGSLVLLIFIIICTIIYFLALFTIMLRNKKEQDSLNKALQELNNKEEEKN